MGGRRQLQPGLQAGCADPGDDPAAPDRLRQDQTLPSGWPRPCMRWLRSFGLLEVHPWPGRRGPGSQGMPCGRGMGGEAIRPFPPPLPES